MGCSGSKAVNSVTTPIGKTFDTIGGAIDHVNPLTANGDANSRHGWMGSGGSTPVLGEGMGWTTAEAQLVYRPS